MVKRGLANTLPMYNLVKKRVPGMEFVGKRGDAEFHSYNIPLMDGRTFEDVEVEKRVPGMEFVGKRAPGMEFVGK